MGCLRTIDSLLHYPEGRPAGFVLASRLVAKIHRLRCIWRWRLGFFRIEDHSLPIFPGINPHDRSNRNIDRCRDSCESAIEFDGVILDQQPLHCGWCDIQNYLPILYMLLRNLHPGTKCIHQDVWRAGVLQYPLIERPDDIWTTGCHSHSAHRC